MSAQFTPGPWALGKMRKYRIGIDGESWTDLAKVVVRMDDGFTGIAVNSPDGYANARLIAAAPDLYEALRALSNNIGAASLARNPLGIELRAAAERALAKATGQ